MEGVCKMYEEHLKRMNPNSPSITYISQFDFIGDLADLSCVVYWADTQTYQPYNKHWIKEKIYGPNRLETVEFRSIRGMGVGLEHSSVQCAVAEVLYYIYPVSILVYPS